MKYTLRYAIFTSAFLVLGVFSFAQQFTLLKDINFGEYTGPGYPREPLNLTEANGKLFFTIYGSGGNAGLWQTDGTAEGTIRVKAVAFIDRMINVNGTLFFVSDQANELWKSDGTEQGTTLVKNITGDNLINVNDILFFRTYDGGLWKTDGSASGTVLIKSFVGPGSFTNVSGTLFFTAAAGPPVSGIALWKSDGTEAGTVKLSDNLGQYTSIREFLSAQGRLYFVVDYGTTGFELWKSDGTAGGTGIVKKIDPVVTFSNISHLSALNDLVYFLANTETNNVALWRTDGSESGTFVVKELNEGSYPQKLFAFDNNLFFSAFDQVHGMELWKSDGTSVGTQMLKDIFPGYNGTDPIGAVPGTFST
jgi:ELWxxDGT repeat protein